VPPRTYSRTRKQVHGSFSSARDRPPSQPNSLRRPRPVLASEQAGRHQPLQQRQRDGVSRLPTVKRAEVGVARPASVTLRYFTNPTAECTKRAYLGTVSVPMPAGRRRTAAETPFPRKGGTRIGVARSSRHEESRTAALPSSPAAVVCFGPTRCFRIAEAERAPLPRAVTPLLIVHWAWTCVAATTVLPQRRNRHARGGDY
jgi:hypothetical protein